MKKLLFLLTLITVHTHTSDFEELRLPSPTQESQIGEQIPRLPSPISIGPSRQIEPYLEELSARGPLQNTIDYEQEIPLPTQEEIEELIAAEQLEARRRLQELSAKGPALNQSISYQQQTQPQTTDQKKKYRCTFLGSGKTFASPSKLQIHIRVHNAVKQFKCDTCNKTFSQKQNLTTHRKNIHGEEQ